MKERPEIQPRGCGGGFKFTFGDSQAAVNLMSSILQQPEYQRYRRKVCRKLSKQIEGMTALGTIGDKAIRDAMLGVWHGQFASRISDLPEIVKTHTRCVETGFYRQLLRRT